MRLTSLLCLALGVGLSDAFSPSALWPPSSQLSALSSSAYLGSRLSLGLSSRLSASRPLSTGVRSLNMLRDEYDLIVIGGGPTGVTAVLQAAAMGRSTIIVDATPKRQVQFTGPTGLFSKALRDSAKKIDVSTLRQMGLRDVAVWRQVQEMTSDIMKASGQSNVDSMRLQRIPHLRGKAEVTGSNEVSVSYPGTDRKATLKGKNIFIATGSTPYRLGSIPYDDIRIFDSDSIRSLAFLPKTVTIVGAGIIAIEFAKIFSRLDCKVTMIVRQKGLDKALTRIGIDGEIALQLQKDLCLNKVRIVFDSEIDEIIQPDKPHQPMNIKLKQSSTGEAHPNGNIRSDILMTATGRSANTKGLGLEEAGIEVDKQGNVVVDTQLQTTLKGVYAAGDVLGAPSLASTGIDQATTAINMMFGKIDSTVGAGWMKQPEGKDPRSLLSSPLQYPIGIWTLPEMAFIGRTAERARADGWTDVGEGVALYKDSIRGKVQGVNFGLLKLVYSKPDGTILGVHILGEDACELIHYGTALAQSRQTVKDVVGVVFTAVTFHELFRMAATDAIKQLEDDKWTNLLDSIGVDAEGNMEVTRLVAGLTAARMNSDDVAEIDKELRVPGATKVDYEFARGVVKKYPLPQSISGNGISVGPSVQDGFRKLLGV